MSDETMTIVEIQNQLRKKQSERRFVSYTWCSVYKRLPCNEVWSRCEKG